MPAGVPVNLGIIGRGEEVALLADQKDVAGSVEDHVQANRIVRDQWAPCGDIATCTAAGGVGGIGLAQLGKAGAGEGLVGGSGNADIANSLNLGKRGAGRIHGDGIAGKRRRWAAVYANPHAIGWCHGIGPSALALVDLIVELGLLDEGQNVEPPVIAIATAGIAGSCAPLVSHGKGFVRVVMHHHPQADLPEVVLARHPASRLARHLHGGKQQRDKHADDGDHYQEFHQRKAGSRARVKGHRPPADAKEKDGCRKIKK